MWAGEATASVSARTVQGMARSQAVAAAMNIAIKASWRGRRIHCRHTKASTWPFDSTLRRRPSISSLSLIAGHIGLEPMKFEAWGAGSGSVWLSKRDLYLAPGSGLALVLHSPLGEG